MIFRDKSIFETRLFNINYVIQLSAVFNFVFFIRSLSKPIEIPLIFLSLITIITVHELGHAFLCKLFNLEVDEICIHFAGGYCSHDSCNYSYQEILIAWGGVFAQLIILLLISILYIIIVKINLIYNRYINIFFNIFIYHNIFFIIYNLLPLEGLDGSKAWSFITNYINFKRDLKLFSNYQENSKRKKMKKSNGKIKLKTEQKLKITKEMEKEAKEFADNVLKNINEKIK